MKGIAAKGPEEETEQKPKEEKPKEEKSEVTKKAAARQTKKNQKSKQTKKAATNESPEEPPKTAQNRPQMRRSSEADHCGLTVERLKHSKANTVYRRHQHCESFTQIKHNQHPERTINALRRLIKEKETGDQKITRTK